MLLQDVAYLGVLLGGALAREGVGVLFFVVELVGLEEGLVVARLQVGAGVGCFEQL